MKKIKFVSIAILLIMSTFCYAQDAKYIYKPLTGEGCQVSFTTNGVNGTRTILVKITANSGIAFSADPEMMLVTMENDTLLLKGKNLHPVTDGVYKHGVTAEYGYARFPISDKQVRLLRRGIKVVRFTTQPWIHQREFEKDKIGRRLYAAFTR